MKQKYAITKHSKTIHPNTFRQLKKQSKFRQSTAIYTVERLRPSSDQFIGHYTSLKVAKSAVKHHAFNVLKKTTSIDVKLNSGKGFKAVSI